MLAGDAGAVAMEAVEGAVDPSAVATRSFETCNKAADSYEEVARSIVFVDSTVDDLDVLEDAVAENSELILLDSSRDGIEQITEHLHQRRDVRSVHLLGHGSSGKLHLGNKVIDHRSLLDQQELLRSWRDVLSTDADVLVYGCDTGAGDAGRFWMETLAQLTSADVAASSNTTGAKDRNGDWILERTVGDIEAAIAFDRHRLAEYSSVLPIDIYAAGVTNEEIMQVQVGGQTVATINGVGGDAYGGLFEQYRVQVDNANINDVRILFTNDLYDEAAGIDRNLRVDRVVLDGVTYQTEDPSVFSTGTWKPEDGIVAGFRQSEFLHTDGYFQYSGPQSNGSVITITARGQTGNENLDLQIDGQTVASYESVGTTEQELTFVADEVVTADQIRVVFTNDRYEPENNIDYNLIINRITVDETAFETEAPTVFSTGTWKLEDGIVDGFRESEVLHTNGYFQYATQPVDPPPPPPPSIRINAGGPDYVDTQGNTWVSDDAFVAGNQYSTTAEIFQTEEDALYQTERWQNALNYDIPVDSGTYDVNLHFAEIFFDDFGQRVFDITVEDQLFREDFDIFATAKNAFFPGNNNAVVLTVSQLPITDGQLDLDMIASINNAKISAIEIVPVTGPQVLFAQTSGNTAVAEGGADDSYTVVLNEQPTSNVTVEIQTDSTQLSLSASSLVFTPQNWDQAQTVNVAAVNDQLSEGAHFRDITHAIRSGDSRYDNQPAPSLRVRIADDDTVAVDFNQRTIASVDNPTTAAFGPDGRLYVGSTTGVITALTLDDNNDVTATEVINALQGLSNNNILGIAFNPFDTSGTPNIYVAHSQLFANGGSSFPETQLSPYSGAVSVLSGPNFDNVQSLITGLPVSNHDHGINGLAFDEAGDLLIAVGGNTNAGITNSRLGGIPESPFSAAVLKARITEANFNGQIDYVLRPGFTPPSGLTFDAADSQTWGDQVLVAPGVDVEVFAAGLRNPYDLVVTTSGEIYVTDNGPNNGFGDVSTGPDTQQPVTGAPDELNRITNGGYFGHPNRTRGVSDAIQNIYFGPNEASASGYTAPLSTYTSSTNGIDEYRSVVFGGQLQGQLVAQKYNGQVFFTQLNEDGTSVEQQDSRTDVADGLDIVMGSGGTLFGIDFVQDRITVAEPVDASSSLSRAYDLLHWRAPAIGGSKVIIGGANFGDLNSTSVSIGGKAMQITRVSNNRIEGILPNLQDVPDTLLDVIVTSNGNTTILQDAFRPLFV